jgi:hypothetical protein
LVVSQPLGQSTVLFDPRNRRRDFHIAAVDDLPPNIVNVPLMTLNRLSSTSHWGRKRN